MGDELTHRLATTAADLQRYRTAAAQLDQLRARVRHVEADLVELRDAATAAERAVQRLESPSLARILTSIRGTLGDRVTRLRTGADAARDRVADAESRLATLTRETGAAQADLDRLASAPADHDAALAERERELTGSDQPAGARLLELADERVRVADDARDSAAAVTAAGVALAALAQLHGAVAAVSNRPVLIRRWPVSQTLTLRKLDRAAVDAVRVRQSLVELGTELAALKVEPLPAWSVDLTQLTQLAGAVLSTVGTELEWRRRLRDAIGQVDGWTELVTTLRARLTRRNGDARRRLAAIDLERTGLLIGPQ